MFGSPPKPPSPTWQGPSSRYGSESSKPSPQARKPTPEDYKSLPAFEYVNLTRIKVHNPNLYAAITPLPESESSKPKLPKPSKAIKFFKTSTKPPPSADPLPKPIGYTPQPPMSTGSPQHLCPICSTPIGHGENQDFTGNLPCQHRGSCRSPKCIQAYYGTSDGWALPYTGTQPIYCQAPGCGSRIEAWCEVKCLRNKGSALGGVYFNIAYRDPEVIKAENEEESRRAEEMAAARTRRANPPGERPVGCKARVKKVSGAVATYVCCGICMLCDSAAEAWCGCDCGDFWQTAFCICDLCWCNHSMG